MDESGDVFHLIVAERELGHAGTAAPNDRRNALAVLVVEHNRRSEQARAAVAAAGIGAVAELAIDAVQRFASLDRFRIARGEGGIGIAGRRDALRRLRRLSRERREQEGHKGYKTHKGKDGEEMSRPRAWGESPHTKSLQDDPTPLYELRALAEARGAKADPILAHVIGCRG